MATAHIKKVIKIGGSLAIILPIEWTKGKIEPGEEMVVIGDEDLRIFPVHLKIASQNTKDKTENA